MNDFLADEGAQAGDEHSVGMTPLIDVVFQLLVFFLLTSTFASPTLELSLPTLDTETATTAEGALNIEIDAAGYVHLDGGPALTDLTAALSTYDPETVVSLHADRATPYERVTQVLAALGEANLSQVQFVYENSGGASE